MYGTGTNLPINESEKQDAYQEFFKNKLKDYGVEFPSELSDEDKSKFFSEIKSEWKGGINEAVKLLQHRGIEPAGLMVPAVNVDGEVGVIFGGTFKIKDAAKAKKIEAQLKALGIKPAEFGGGYDDLMYEINDGAVEIDDKEVICYMVIDNPDSLAEVLEISDYAESCRFKDCKHINEPGCAVLEAVNSGVLDYKVYASYLKLRREAWHFSASEHEKRKKEKSFTKLVEEVKNRKANR